MVDPLRFRDQGFQPWHRQRFYIASLFFEAIKQPNRTSSDKVIAISSRQSSWSARGRNLLPKFQVFIATEQMQSICRFQPWHRQRLYIEFLFFLAIKQPNRTRSDRVTAISRRQSSWASARGRNLLPKFQVFIATEQMQSICRQRYKNSINNVILG